MVQQRQCEMVFKAEANPAVSATLDEIEWLAGLLKGRGWLTAAKIVTMGGVKDERKIRAIARAAAPGIFSYPGSPGYKLFKDCTMEEVNHGVRAMESQVRDMTVRCALYKRAYHSQWGGLS